MIDEAIKAKLEFCSAPESVVGETHLQLRKIYFDGSKGATVPFTLYIVIRKDDVETLLAALTETFPDQVNAAIAKYDLVPNDKHFLTVCPGCGYKFPVNLDCISIRGCESDSHYGTDLDCPKCGFTEDIHYGAGN